MIRFKKPLFPISDSLKNYLLETHRYTDLPIRYQDVLQNTTAITLYDKVGKDILWETLLYSESDRQYVHEALRKIYALLKVGGDVSVFDHLYVERVDHCLYANTHPIRVRIVNKLNDLFDYFYIKQADASRVYGMELEHLLSPNKINYLVYGDTFIEEHIQGIPGEAFINQYLKGNTNYNPLRIAKEFVKFNERSLVQLLGDMRRDNFVVEIIPDFDELHFRLRSIDFDQECYEGNHRIYMPQFFKENNPIINLGLKAMTSVLELQYQKEERTRILNRTFAAGDQLNALLEAMAGDTLSTPEHVNQLKHELAELYDDKDFLTGTTMGEILRTSLAMLEKYPVRKRTKVKSGKYA